jgi:ATP-dependent DNA helicase RecG
MTASSRSRIFISSVQKELAAERQALKSFITGDALLRRFFDVFLFEELPASGRRADEVYLEEVDRCDIYVGIFGDVYGREGPDGLSPTEREYDCATSNGKHRLIFVKGSNDTNRHPRMQALIRKAGDQLIRRRFEGIPSNRCEFGMGSGSSYKGCDFHQRFSR